MVAPLVVAGAVVAANALAQGYMANKSMKANKQRLNEIKAAFAQIVPPELATDIETWTRDHADIIPDIAQMPSFDFLTPEMYQVIAKYNPQQAEFIKTKSPQLAERSAVGVEGLEAQRAALRKLMTTGQMDQDPELMQKFAEADRNAQIGAQSRQQSIMQDFARRGQGGSGLQLASQMGSASDAMDRSSQSSQAAASESYKNRLNQLMIGADLGGQMESRDMSMQQRNADVINRFNEMTSKNYQDYQNRRADTANEAQRFNIGQAQDTADRNVGLQNQYKEKKADIAKWGYDATNMANQKKFDNILQAMAGENATKSMAFDQKIAKAKAEQGIGSHDPMQYWAPVVQKGFDTVTSFAADKYGSDRDDRRAEFEKTGKWRD